MKQLLQCNKLRKPRRDSENDCDSDTEVKSKEEIQEEVDEISDPLLQRTCVLPDETIKVFQDSCSELLMSALVLKDHFDPSHNGLESLPVYVRDMVLPWICSELKRPYVIQGEDKLVVTSCVPSGSLDVASGASSGQEMTNAKVYPVDEGTLPGDEDPQHKGD